MVIKNHNKYKNIWLKMTQKENEQLRSTRHFLEEIHSVCNTETRPAVGHVI